MASERLVNFCESKRLGGSLSLARQARRPTGGQYGQVCEGAGQFQKVMQGTLMTQRLSAAASLPQTLLPGSVISNFSLGLMSALIAGSWIGPACSFQEHARIRHGIEENGPWQGKEVLGGCPWP